MLPVWPSCETLLKHVRGANVSVKMFPGFAKAFVWHTVITYTTRLLKSYWLFSLRYARDWRYHKDERLWLTRAPGVEPQLKTSTYERGTYYFFDCTTWRKVAKDFHLEYDKLEDKPTLQSVSAQWYLLYSCVFGFWEGEWRSWPCDPRVHCLCNKMLVLFKILVKSYSRCEISNIIKETFQQLKLCYFRGCTRSRLRILKCPRKSTGPQPPLFGRYRSSTVSISGQRIPYNKTSPVLKRIPPTRAALLLGTHLFS